MALHMLQTTVDVLDGRQTAGRRGPVQHADFGGGRHGNVTGAAVVRDMSGHENLNFRRFSRLAAGAPNSG